MAKYKIAKEDLHLENITAGQIVKNYNEFCGLLGIKPKQGGTSRVSQIRELEQYINFEKIDRCKILIKEIYTIAKPKEDKRKEGNHSVYRDELLAILIGIFRKTKKNHLLCSRGWLIQELGFYNKNYRNCRNNVFETSKQLKIPEQNLLDFFMVNDTRIIKNVDSNLNYFSDKTYFFVNRVTAICIKSNSKEIHRIATHDEIEFISNCANQVKKDMGIQSDAEIFYRNLWDSYNSKLKDEFKKQGSNIAYYYKAYDFGFSEDVVEELYQKYIKGNSTTVGKTKKELNSKSKSAAFTSVDRRIGNAEKRIKDGKNNKFAMERDLMITDKSFKKHSKKLINNLISDNAKEIQLNIFEDYIPYEDEITED